MPIVLKDLIQRPADVTLEKPYDLLLEAEIAERYINQDKDSFKVMDIEKTSKELDQVARRTAISCPDCGGAIWRMKDGNVERYRCHLGHAFSGDSLLVRNKESLEESLWVALRMLEERKYVLVTLSEEIAEQHGDKAASYKERADELQVHVERIRQVITNFNDSDLNPDNNDSSQSANAS
jgi:two-component system chemotaxis response regulator CheB